MRLIDCTGMKRNMLKAISQNTTHPLSASKTMWNCECDCGGKIVVEGYKFRNGEVKSCGCLRRSKRTTNPRHGNPLYNVYYAMINRCYNDKNKSYKNYGGRGVLVCDEWLNDFLSFESWMISKGYTKGMTIERIDNSKEYHPDNCRLATQKEQQRNRRNNVIISFNGTDIYATDLAEIMGVSKATISRWVKKGIIYEKIMTHNVSR